MDSPQEEEWRRKNASRVAEEEAEEQYLYELDKHGIKCRECGEKGMEETMTYIKVVDEKLPICPYCLIELEETNE